MAKKVVSALYKSKVAMVEQYLGCIANAPTSALPTLKDQAIAHIIRSGRDSYDLIFAIRQCKSPPELSMLSYSRPELFFKD
jgi:hypothetical protein